MTHVVSAIVLLTDTDMRVLTSQCLKEDDVNTVSQNLAQYCTVSH